MDSIGNKTAIYFNNVNDSDIENLRKFILAENLENAGEYSADDPTNNFHKLIHDIHEGKIETVVVNELKELHKDPSKAIKTIEHFSKLKIEFISISDQLNSLSQDKLVFSYKLIKAIERLKSIARSGEIKNGIKTAKEKGRRLGRPRIKKAIKDKALLLREQGKPYRDIGAELKVDEKTVRNWVKAEQDKINNQKSDENN